MHDPMVVAHELPLPIPERKKYRERPNDKRWTLGRRRRTNPENLGEPVYPWWRLTGWDPRFAGRCFGLRRFATVWHVEPNGRDSGEVCKHWVNGKHRNRWRWHFWHWHIQVHFEQRLRRFLLERCELCGHRYPWGYAPVSHSWDSPGSRWRDGVVRMSYHSECSSLKMSRGQVEGDERIIRQLVAALCLAWDKSEHEVIDQLTGHNSEFVPFHDRYRLTRMFGYERNSDYDLVKPE